MGNCLLVCGHNRVSCLAAVETSKNANIVQLLKSDGEILEFSTPVLVKDVLTNFSGFNIALAEKTPLHLPPDFWLKLGNKYHLIPSVETLETVEEPQIIEKDGGVKRIKVVITKKQLQDLLSQEVLAVDIISVLRSKTCDDYDDDDEDDSRIWKPKLESIPEEHETGSLSSVITS
ncbi:hypothetical protein ACET3Z_009105 [Daucus carota]